jgi:hypothetical protein
VTSDELDEVRKIVVAFEDAATWCEQLAELARESVRGLQRQPDARNGDLPQRLNEISRMLQHLEADRHAVLAVRKRIGLPPPSSDGAPRR